MGISNDTSFLKPARGASITATRARAPPRPHDVGVGGRPHRRRGPAVRREPGDDRGEAALMRFENAHIPLDAAWSSPFVRWQGPAAERVEPRRGRAGDRAGDARARRSTARRSTSSCSGYRPAEAVVLRRADARRAARAGHRQRAADHAGVRDLGGVRARRGRGRRRDEARRRHRPHEQRAARRLPERRRARRHAAERELGDGQLRLRPEHRRGDARHRRARRRRRAASRKEQVDAVTARRWEQYEEALDGFQKRWMVPITVGSKRKPTEIDADWGIRPAPLETLSKACRR